MKKQNKHYHQLTQEPRYQISGLRKAGMSLRAIAKEVGVHSSTVSRELRRNASEGGYDPVIAHKLSESRKTTALKSNKRLERTDTIIRDFLVFRWSPETISQRLKIEAEKHEQLSHSTIYWRIEEDRQRGGSLFRQLPRFGKTRWKGGRCNDQNVEKSSFSLDYYFGQWR